VFGLSLVASIAVTLFFLRFAQGGDLAGGISRDVQVF